MSEAEPRGRRIKINAELDDALRAALKVKPPEKPPRKPRKPRTKRGTTKKLD